MKLSVSTQYIISAYGDKAGLEKIRDIGYTAVDFTMEAFPRNGLLYTGMDETAFRRYFSDLKAHADKLGISVGQCHAHIPTPFTSTAPSEREMFSVLVRDIIATASLGCPYLVIHPAIPRECVRGKGAKKAAKLNQALFRDLKPFLLENGVKLGVENMFNRDKSGRICPTVCSTPEEMLAYIDFLGDEAAVACLDIGHVNLTQEEAFPSIEPCKMIEMLGPHLKLLHLHDNDGQSDKHAPPATGNVPWDRVMQALANNHFDGNLSFELKSSTDSALQDARVAYHVGQEFLGRYFPDEAVIEK